MTADGWDDLFGDEDVPAKMAGDFARAAQEGSGLNLSISPDAWSAAVSGATIEPAPEPEEQPRADETTTSDESDAGGLFGSDDQFHVAWKHWNGMPEFHMDDLRPDSTLVIKFRTPEDRESFASLLRSNVGIEVRKEEPRGIWYPKIVIAHFWDKRYRDVNAETVDNTPIVSEADEGEDEAEALDDSIVKQVASIEEGSE